MSIKDDASKFVLMKGLPANIPVEKWVLGSILLNAEKFDDVSSVLDPTDFAMESHRRIYIRMRELRERSEPIDRITVTNELMRYKELESIGGLSYLISLDEYLPALSNIDQYIKIIRDKAILRRIAISGHQLMSQALIGEDDPGQILEGAEQTLRGLSDERAPQGELIKPGEIIQAFPGGINAFLDPTKRAVGVRTGFTRLDELTGGLHDGDLFILAARPSHGKTALLLNISWFVAVHMQRPVAIFSLEMSQESLLNRIICAAARVDSQRFRAGYLNQGERQKLRDTTSRLMEAPIYIDDTASLSVPDMSVKLRRCEQKLGRPLGLVGVDYIQLLASRGKRAENRNQEVSAMSRGLKLMAKEHETPVIALSQLSRATETRTGDHRPQLSDLRESGSLEQDADVVAFVFRQELYSKDREDLRGVAELILSKQRNGPIGKIDLVFLHGQTRFENRAEDLAEQEYL